MWPVTKVYFIDAISCKNLKLVVSKALVAQLVSVCPSN